MRTLPSWLFPIELPMPATLGSINVYLIRGKRGIALIDTGMNDVGSRKELVSQLKGHGLELADIDTLVCTHHHADHAGLGQTFTQAGAATMMSRVDAESLKMFFDQPELDTTRASFGKSHPVPQKFAERVSLMFPFFRSLSEPFEPQMELEEGQKLDLGGIELEVMHTPGHTLGHICLRHADGIVFTGDCITAGDATHVSMRPEAIGKDPLGKFLRSLERLRDLHGNVGLSGHGAPIEDLSSKAITVIEHHLGRLAQVESALGDEPQTAFELSLAVMGKRPVAFARWLAMSQVLAYLEHSIRMGRAQMVEDERGIKYRRPV